jgi:tetratricopeptide (TPR) repeat protein
MEGITLAIGVLGSIGLVGGGFLVWAYRGAGSVGILFREVMPLPAGLSPAAEQQFQQGIATYIRGQYARSVDHFKQVNATQPQPCVAAVHNLGLAWANLKQDDRAVRELLRAADLYAQQDDTASVDLVKQQLLNLRQRRSDRT